MAVPSVPYTFTNGTVIDAAQHNSNFNAIISALTDGLADLTVASITAGTGSFTTLTGTTTNATTFKMGAGSLATPALGFTADDDSTGTGIYRKAANSMGFVANGVEIGSYTSAGAWTFGTGTSSTHTFNGNGTFAGNKLGVGIAINNAISLYVSSTAGLSGTTQYGVFNDVTSSSGATTQAVGYYGTVRTAAASFTCALATTYWAIAHQKGAGSTITRSIDFYTTSGTGTATNSAKMADNASFTTDFIFNFTAALPSVFNGNLCSTRTDVASAASITSLTGNVGFVKLTGSTATTLHGIGGSASTGVGVDGARLVLYNATGQNMTIKHNSASATGFQIVCLTGADITTTTDGAAEFIFDGAQNKWICLYATA